MIFLDNSSSSYYKPPAVISAVANALRFLPFNASRAGHSGALKSGMLVYHARKSLADFFGASAERVIFTSGCTEALNLAILGSVARGGHVITTPFEHNSVLRPLYHLTQTAGVKLSFVTSAAAAQAAIKPNTCLIAVNHVSNVTGAEADIAAYGEVAAQSNIPLLVDAAQSAGHIPIDMTALKISYLAIAPHKGLHAAQGVGALIVGDGAVLKPIKFGGTGTASSAPVQPLDFPEGFESGTLPLPAIAGLNAGLAWTRQNFEDGRIRLLELSGHLIERLEKQRGIKLYSRPNVCGIVAFVASGYASQEVGDILSEQYDVAVRCGFHCAPLLHEFYGTKNGMIRASIGCTNTYADIDFLISALSDLF